MICACARARARVNNVFFIRAGGSEGKEEEEGVRLNETETRIIKVTMLYQRDGSCECLWKCEILRLRYPGDRFLARARAQLCHVFTPYVSSVILRRRTTRLLFQPRRKRHGGRVEDGLSRRDSVRSGMDHGIRRGTVLHVDPGTRPGDHIGRTAFLDLRRASMTPDVVVDGG